MPDPRALEADVKLRIWHMPNIPGPIFTQEVGSLAEGVRALRLIADYDLFLGERVISSNAQGLEMLEDNEWVEWSDEDGYTLDDLEREGRLDELISGQIT